MTIAYFLGSLGNADLTAKTAAVIEQFLKGKVSFVDMIDSLNDLTPKQGSITNYDATAGIISALKVVEAVAGYFRKIPGMAGLGLNAADLYNAVDRAQREFQVNKERTGVGSISDNTMLEVSTALLGLVAQAAITVGAASAGTMAGPALLGGGFLLIVLGAIGTSLGVINDRSTQDLKNALSPLAAGMANLGRLTVEPFIQLALDAPNADVLARRSVIGARLLDIDPSLSGSEILTILDASASSMDGWAESIATTNALLKVFRPDAGQMESNTSYEDYIAAVGQLGGIYYYGIHSLAGANIAGNAMADGPDGLAFRYALKELSPIAIVGADYSRYNQKGELELYDPATDTGSLSQQWITDRAAMLKALLKAHIEERFDTIVDSTADYFDLATRTRLGPGGLAQTGVVFGTDGGDRISVTNTRGESGRLYGMGGNDNIYGGMFADHIEGGSGADNVHASEGADEVWGGADSDTLNGDGGADTLYGQTGGDTIYGGDQADTIYGDDANPDNEDYDSGNDEIDGGSGNDTLYGGGGADTIKGGSDNDILYGNAGKDELDGEEGSDTLEGGDDDDILVGGTGKDTLRGGDDADTLYGDAKDEDDTGNGDNDMLFGGKGKDTLYGGIGVDVLSGEEDDDTLDGNGGADMLLGGKGTDTYKYSGANGGSDYIKDEREGAKCLGSVEYDKIKLTGGKETSKDSHTWKSDDGFVYSTNGDPDKEEVTLTITGGQGGKLTVLQFKNHDLGIDLTDGDDGIPPPPPPPPPSGGGWADRRDPLLLDLTGLGITTVGLDVGLHFDHNGDGLKEGTGWAGVGTGLLMLDRDANGQLTDGTELFGDTTPVNGGIAVTGFAALAQYDRNQDGKIDANDPVWSQLKVWRHTRNPVTGEILIDDPDYAGELVSLDELGIVTIHLDSQTTGTTDANGNTQLSSATLELADGSTRTIAEYALSRNGQDTVAASLQNINADIRLLPNLNGMGGTYDLHQAMQKNPALKALAQQFVAEVDATKRQTIFDQLIYTWAGVQDVAPDSRGTQTSNFGASKVQIDARHFAALEVFYGKTLGKPTFEDAVAWELTWRRLTEGFYASLEAQSHLAEPMSHVALTTDSSGRVTNIELAEAIDYFTNKLADDPATARPELADFARTLRGYGLGTNTNYLKFREVMRSLDSSLGWVMDSAGFQVVELHQDIGHAYSMQAEAYLTQAIIGLAPRGYISDAGLNGVGGDDVIYGRDDPAIGDWILQEYGDSILVGRAGNDWIQAGAGDDFLEGDDGDDDLKGEAGNDKLDGGAGNDYLMGGEGHDSYIFRKGYGKDIIIESGTEENTIIMAELIPSEVVSGRRGNDLVLTIRSTGETIVVANCFAATNSKLEFSVVFDDGTKWLSSDFSSDYVGSDGDDYIVGDSRNDVITGNGGSDYLCGLGGNDKIDGGTGNDAVYGDVGSDTLIGGVGDDLLSGGAGNDTYAFGRNDGNDVVVDRDATAGNVDTIRLTDGLTPDDVTLSNTGANLVIAIGDTGNSITVRNAFRGDEWRVEQLVFDDGTVWDWGAIQTRAVIRGTPGVDALVGTAVDETLEGYAGNDMIAGGGGSDTLDGGAGDDFLLGRAGDQYRWNTYDAANGNDTYLFGVGDGHDTLIDRDSTLGNTDTVRLKDGVTPSDVVLRKRGNDMVLMLNGTDDTLTLRDWFDPDSRIEQLRFADGTVWNAAEMKSRIGLGGPGDDVLIGSDDADVIAGAGGNDLLAGGRGDDVYRFGFGDGHDLLQEDAAAGFDTIELTPGIAAGDVSLRRRGDDLVLTLKGDNDVLTISSWFLESSANWRVDAINFADGTTWMPADIRLLTLEGTSASETLIGYDSDDVIAGRAGGDRLLGGAGNDTYRFERGDGWDDIADASGTDAIRLGEGIAPGDVALSMDNADLLIKIGSEGLRVKGFNGAGRIEQLEFADGTVWMAEAISLLAGPPVDGSLIIGTPQADTLVGSAGRDTILGQDEADTLDGAGGDDVLIGGSGADTLNGGAGADELHGGGLRDYGAEVDADVLNGGTGDDVISGGANDTFVVTRGGGFDTLNIYSTDGFGQTVRFGPGIAPSDLSVQMNGRRRDPYHEGGAPPRIAIGIGGNEGALLELPNAGYYGGDGSPLDGIDITFVFDDGTTMSLAEIAGASDGGIVGYNYNDDESDWLLGSVANDEIYGGWGGNGISARDNEDYVDGGDGNDAIDAGDGNDTVLGGSGNDVIAGGKGDDVLSAELSDDGSGGAWGADLLAFNRGDGNDVIEADPDGGVDSVSFGVGVLPDDVAVKVLASGALVLAIDGGAGGTLTFQSSASNALAAFQAGFPVAKVQFVDADGRVRVLDIQALLADNLDTLLAGGSVSLAGATTVAGELTPIGGDYAVAYAQTGDLFGTTYFAPADAPTDGADTLRAPDGGGMLDGGAGNDIVVGSGGIDQLYGGLGDDTIAGGTGDDMIEAGPGNDLAVGGDGADTYVFKRGDGVLSIREETGQGGENTLSFGEGIASGDLRLSYDNDALVISAGNGDMVRLLGYDPSDPVASAAVGQIGFSDGTTISVADLIARGLDLTGTTGDDVLVGSGFGDRIVGDTGDDVLVGMAGNDILAGGGGDDVYVFSRGGGVDTIDDQEAAVTGNAIRFDDTGIALADLSFSFVDGNMVIDLGNGDQLRVLGVAGPEFAAAGPIRRLMFADGTTVELSALFGDTNVIQGTPEADTLIGSDAAGRFLPLAGNDTMHGGMGNDTYVVASGGGVDTIDDIATGSAGNELVLDMPAIDAAKLRLSYDPAAATLNLVLPDGEVRLTGFDSNTPLGTHAVETFRLGVGGPVLSYAELIARGFDIEGTAGDDWLLGTATTDRIVGGAGNDRIESGVGGDAVAGDAGDDAYVFKRGDGVLTIADVATVGEGNSLEFGEGITRADLARALRFRAPAGSDPGEFTIRLGEGGDEVRMRGFDPANPRFGQHAVEYFRFSDGTVMSYAEVLQQMFVVQGDESANTLSGTAVGDRLYGYESNDALEAGAGDDVLTGGTGNDTLRGGDGRDAYVFNRGDGIDVIDDTNVDGIGNILTFGPDVRQEDLSFSYEGTTLVIGYGAGDELRIHNQDGDSGLVVDTVELLSDGSAIGLSDAMAVAMNSAPTIAGTVATQSAAEDSVWQYTLPSGLFVDPDGGTVTLTACQANGNPLPSWLAFDSVTGIFSGTPENIDVGSLSLRIIGTDALGATTSTTFSLSIVNVNDVPVVTATLTDAVATQDAAFSYVLPAGLFRDMDKGDVLTYGATLADGSALPAWLSFDAATGELSGTPRNADVGALSVRVTATDLAGATASTAFAIAVNNINDAPTYSGALAAVTVKQGDVLAISLPDGAFTDIDAGDSLIYSATVSDGSALPSWLAIDPWTGTLSGQPGNSDVGQLHITVTATDMSGTTAFGSFQLTVANVNDAPVVANQIADQNIKQGDDFSFVVATAFSDLDSIYGDTLTYAATQADGSALPSWLVFDATTGTLSGTPDNGDVGNLSILVAATDAGGLTASQTFGVLVANVNDAPVVASQIADQSAKQGQAFSLAIPAGTFGDVDQKHGDRLTLSLTQADGGALPSWLSFDAATNTLSGTPGAGDVGSLDLRLTATDTGGLTAFENLHLDVSASALTIPDIPGATLMTGTGWGDFILGRYFASNKILGLEGNDWLLGGAKADYIDGGDGIDYLGAGAGNDILIGGKGTDYVEGGIGSDTYVFAKGAGVDYITDADSSSGDTDTAMFVDVSSGDVTSIERNGNDLVLNYGVGDQVTVCHYFAPSLKYRVEQFKFNDGVTWNDATIKANVVMHGTACSDYIAGDSAYGNRIYGLGGADWLLGGAQADLIEGGDGTDYLGGGAGNDTLDGGTGTDYLEGGQGSDTYLFGRGAGTDYLSENDATLGNTDAAQFSSDVSCDQLWFRHVGNNLEASIIGTSDTLTIQNWYSGSAYHLEQFKTADGKTLTDSQVESLVQAMASFAPPTSGQTTLPTNYQTALQPIIAANWQ